MKKQVDYLIKVIYRFFLNNLKLKGYTIKLFKT